MTLSSRRFDVVLLGTGFVVLSFYLMIHEMGLSFFGLGQTAPSDIYQWLYKLAGNCIVLWIGLVMIATGLGIEFRSPVKQADDGPVLIPYGSGSDDLAGDQSISRLSDIAFKVFLLFDIVAVGLLLYEVVPMTYYVFGTGMEPNLWFYVYSAVYGLSVLAFSIFIYRNRDSI